MIATMCRLTILLIIYILMLLQGQRQGIVQVEILQFVNDILIGT